MSDEVQQPKLSDSFSKMAGRIDRNIDEKFGGAFVIVPPASAGLPCDLLLLNDNPDPATFWMMLQSVVTRQLQEIETKQAQSLGYRR